MGTRVKMIRLTYRERWLVVGLVVFIMAWAFFALVIRPAIDRMETLGRVIPQKQGELAELRTKSEQYLALRTRLDGFKKEAALEEKGFELLAFLESMTAELRLAKKVAAMRQELLQLDSNHCEVIVEVKLESLTLRQLVNFLLKTESSNHLLRIKSLYTKKNTTNPNFLDTVVQISSLKLNQAM